MCKRIFLLQMHTIFCLSPIQILEPICTIFRNAKILVKSLLTTRKNRLRECRKKSESNAILVVFLSFFISLCNSPSSIFKAVARCTQHANAIQLVLLVFLSTLFFLSFSSCCRVQIFQQFHFALLRIERNFSSLLFCLNDFHFFCVKLTFNVFQIPSFLLPS